MYLLVHGLSKITLFQSRGLFNKKTKASEETRTKANDLLNITEQLKQLESVQKYEFLL